MNITEFYNVVIHRKSQNAAVTLNFVHKATAEKVFAEVAAYANDLPGVGRHDRKVFEDYFGCKIALDRDDIGNVLFIDAVRNLSMQAGWGMLQAKEQAKFQMEARKNPLLNGTLQAPSEGMLRA
jgi:hypothetical protein